MSQQAKSGNYIVVSPVKDEGRYVQKTLESMVAQSLRPRRWVIVDDGSCDETPALLAKYAAMHNWIEVLTVSRDRERRPGRAEVLAFLEGYKRIENEDFDYVVKLDCDLELPPTYFEDILSRFTADPKLGIASGAYEEEDEGSWDIVKMPSYHAAGCSKVVRAECFREIGAFVAKPCWDTLDEIRAQVHGWKTQHFPEIRLHHLKTEGVGVGLLRTSVMHGRSYYLTGGGGIFFSLKVLHRLVFGKPLLLGGLLMAAGYLRSWWSGESRLVTEAEATAYRNVLHQRIFTAVRRRLFSRAGIGVNADARQAVR